MCGISLIALSFNDVLLMHPYSERHKFFITIICLSLDSKDATGKKSASFAIANFLYEKNIVV